MLGYNYLLVCMNIKAVPVCLHSPTSSGNLLDNEDLVLALQQTKEVAIEVEERLAKTQLTQEEVHTARRKYQPVSWSMHTENCYIQWREAVFLSINALLTTTENYTPM